MHPKVINVGLGVLAGAVVEWAERFKYSEFVYSLKFLYAAAIAPPVIFDV